MKSILERFRLDGKAAIVTGGAMGLGKAMAEALAEAGAKIAIADFNKEAGEATAAEIAEIYSVETYFVDTDVTLEKSVIAMVKAVKDRFGSIDILLNNAGIVIHRPLESTTLAEWHKVLDVNLDGVYLVLREVGKVMIAQKSGSIINTSSMSGLIVNVPQPQASYNTSKAAVIMLTKSAAVEWAPYHVRVNTIAPGYMKTKLTEPFFDKGGEMIDTWMRMTPMGRPGTPDELGAAAIFLASDASSFVTGSVLQLDGGYTAP